MTYDQQRLAVSVTQQNKSVFVFRVIRVRDQSRMLVREGGFRLFEADAVLPEIGGGFFFVPFENDHDDGTSVTTM